MSPMDGRAALADAGLEIPDDEIEGIVAWVTTAAAIAGPLRQCPDLLAPPLVDGRVWQEFGG